MLVQGDVGLNDVLRGFGETVDRVDAELTADNDEVDVGVIQCNGVHIAADAGLEVDDQAITRFAQLTDQGFALRGVGAFHGVDIQTVLVLAGHESGVGGVVEALVAKASLLHDHGDLLINFGIHILAAGGIGFVAVVGIVGFIRAGVRVAGTGCK